MNNGYFYCPYMGYVPYPDMHRSPRHNTSYVRVLHASPDAPAVDIYVNDNLAASNLAYKSFTKYLPLERGRYNVKVYPAGSRRNPVIDTEVNIPANVVLTAAAINKLANIEVLPIVEPPVARQPGRAYIRFAHLSPNAPAVDVRLPGGTALFKDVEYKEVTDYILVNPGNQTLEVYVAGTDQRVLYVPNVMLKPNNIYTVYAVGLVGEEPPLEALLPLDGRSYLNI